MTFYLVADYFCNIDVRLIFFKINPMIFREERDKRGVFLMLLVGIIILV